MPSTTLTADNKVTVRRGLAGNVKIYTATVARLYVAYPNPNQWTYTNIWGAVVFLKDKEKNDTFFFRIVDLTSGKGVLWEQEFYQGFEYTLDRPFFHTFVTDEYLAAFSFADEGEASILYKKVTNRENLDGSGGKSKKKKAEKEKKSRFGGSKKSKKGDHPKVDKSQIGLPSDFRCVNLHLGHIGWDPNKGFSVQNIDPEWRTLFDQLAQLGVSEVGDFGKRYCIPLPWGFRGVLCSLKADISKNAKFIQEFVIENGGIEGAAQAMGVKKAAPAAPTPRQQRVPNTPPPVKASAPPPPPPSRKQAPPPPPPVAGKLNVLFDSCEEFGGFGNYPLLNITILIYLVWPPIAPARRAAPPVPPPIQRRAAPLPPQRTPSPPPLPPAPAQSTYTPPPPPPPPPTTYSAPPPPPPVLSRQVQQYTPPAPPPPPVLSRQVQQYTPPAPPPPPVLSRPTQQSTPPP
ncbi:hypothetical protein BC938DRAFT_477071, partial [Jimgerdemannia flammicorona]